MNWSDEELWGALELMANRGPAGLLVVEKLASGEEITAKETEAAFQEMRAANEAPQAITGDGGVGLGGGGEAGGQGAAEGPAHGPPG